jgi:D-alanyl-D-alanine carboxypeptidase/D-alanyl-D-alanine-endopeptidase (penicillin-binding protein 4)
VPGPRQATEAGQGEPPPAGDDPPPRRRAGSGSNGGGGGAAPGRPVRRDDDDGLPPDRSGGPGGRLPGWVVPVILGAGAVMAGVGALLLDRHASAAAVEIAATPVTPVLSARRVPEVIAAPIADRRLTADLQGWLTQSPADTCLVVESGDDTLYAHNPATPLAGASTQKVVTASALLLALGPDARLETVVGAGSSPSRGVVAGDLYLVGGGDPLLTSPGYADQMLRDPTLAVDPMRLVDAIVEAGVTRVDGSVVGDGSRYDGERFHPTWPDRYRTQRNVGPIGALNVNDGVVGVDGRTPPAGPAANDPAAHAASVVTDLLRQRGVTVVGPPRADRAPEGLTEVATFASPTVREIATEMLADSDNDTAEMALKELGRLEGGAGTWEAGTAAVTALLEESGVPLDGVQVVDGSGLSTDNRLTCQLLVDLLTLPETGPAVVEGLAVAGETGTLQDRWDGTPVDGRLRGKTGTLNTVTALSGRVSPLQGGALTFAYVANVPEGQVLDAEDVALQDTLGEILVDYPRGVDVATLVPAQPAGTEPSGDG